jgi:hypothetical protein
LESSTYGVEEGEKKMSQVIFAISRFVIVTLRRSLENSEENPNSFHGTLAFETTEEKRNHIPEGR